MLFNSFEFLVFFPIIVFLYYIVPQRFRYLILCAGSYYFYMCWNPMHALLLLGITFITYLGAILLEKNESSYSIRKAILTIVVLLCLSVLVVFKYENFIAYNMNRVLNIIHINVSVPAFSLVLPVGISFYIFQAIGYTIDVYRGTQSAEKNFLKFATFVAFFPQLVAGPIERAGNLLHQFDEEHHFEWEKVKSNLVLIGWGLFLKIVIADRIAIFVDTVYDNFSEFNGWFIVVASVLFAFQIYCDFQGYTTIAIGVAGTMGFTLMENFNSPYLSTSVKDFWSRWHISLTQWFRDYLYIPLGGNRKGKIRKYINQILVFSISGLWHGAMWNFMVWGFLNGAYLIIEDATRGIRNKIANIFHINRSNVLIKIIMSIFTFIMVDISWIFFRAHGTAEAKLIIKEMLTFNNSNLFSNEGIYYRVLEVKNFWFMIFTIVLLLVVDFLHLKKIYIRDFIVKQNIVVQYIFYIILIESLIVFGIWGPGYDKSAFIYFQF